jgi:hypothetical protein
LTEGKVASPAVPMVAAIAIHISSSSAHGQEENTREDFLYDLKRREPTSAASRRTARQP